MPVLIAPEDRRLELSVRLRAPTREDLDEAAGLLELTRWRKLYERPYRTTYVRPEERSGATTPMYAAIADRLDVEDGLAALSVKYSRAPMDQIVMVREELCFRVVQDPHPAPLSSDTLTVLAQVARATGTPEERAYTVAGVHDQLRRKFTGRMFGESPLLLSLDVGEWIFPQPTEPQPTYNLGLEINLTASSRPDAMRAGAELLAKAVSVLKCASPLVPVSGPKHADRPEGGREFTW